MLNLGDRAVGTTVSFLFNTHKADGTPITLAGTPVISVYKNSTTESTSGVALTVDYDSRTGMHQVVIDTSADGTFYATNNDFNVVITTGTVDSISVVGMVIGKFSIGRQNISHAASTAWASGAITDTVFGTNTYPKAIRTNSTNGAAAGYVDLDGSASSTDNFYVGCSIKITAGDGAGQSRTIISYVGSTKRAYVDRVWVTNPVSATYLINAGKLTLDILNTGVAAAGAAATITLASSAVATNDYYDGARVQIISGTGVGQSRIISGYVGSTRVATVTDGWATQPDNTSVYAVMGLGDVEVGVNNDKTGYALASTAVNVTAIDGAALSTHTAGMMPSDMKAIDNQATSGNNATLYLKQLNIQNNANEAVLIASTGSNKEGLKVTSATGNAVLISGDDNGMRIQASGAASSGILVNGGSGGVGINAYGEVAGVLAEGSGAAGIGLKALGAGSGEGFAAIGGTSGGGAQFTAGISSSNAGMTIDGGTANGLDISTQATDGHGVNIIGVGTGSGINTEGTNGIRAAGKAGGGNGISAVGTLGNNGMSIVGGATGAALAISSTGHNAVSIYAANSEPASTGDGINVSVGAGDGNAVKLTADGLGSGLYLQGGATSGHGIQAIGAGTGAGMKTTGGVDGHGIESIGGAGTLPGAGMSGIYAAGQGVGHGLNVVGSTQGAGLRATGGVDGEGILAEGGNTGGAGIYARGTGTEDGIIAISDGSACGIYAEGATDGDGIKAVGTGLGSGLYLQGGATNGDGITAVAGSGGIGAIFSGKGGGQGLWCVGDGAGAGIQADGGATGHGIEAIGGATSGNGIDATAPLAGHGINSEGGPINGVGIKATGGMAPGMQLIGTGDSGLVCQGGGASGAGIKASGSLGGGAGIEAEATDSGQGILATGGPTGGQGALFRASLPGQAGFMVQGAGATGNDMEMASYPTSMTQLAKSASVIVSGTVDTTAFAPTVNAFECSDITSAGTDYYKGRTAIFTSGVLIGQARRITGYTVTGGRGHFTVDALTSAPVNAVTLVIV